MCGKSILDPGPTVPFSVPPGAVATLSFREVVGNKVASGATVVEMVTVDPAVVRGAAMMLVATETISVAAGTGRTSAV